MKIDNNNLYFYSLLLLLSFLSGNYFGEHFNIIFLFTIILILLNIIHFILAIKNIYYVQTFSTEHPKKGDIINYHIKINNKLPIISSKIYLNFHESINLPNIVTILSRNESKSIKKDFSLPFRGIYHVGCSSLEIEDLLGIFKYKFKIWERTFYVYPRINYNLLNSCKGLGINLVESYSLQSESRDYFNSLNDYTGGVKQSLISWKHFASKGIPLVKNFNSQDSSQIKIFLDKTKLDKYRKNSVEDIALETAISLIHNNLLLKREVNISNWKSNINSFSDFNLYYKNSILEDFNFTAKKTYDDFNAANYLTKEQIIVITPMESSFFLNKTIINKFENLTLFIIKTNMTIERVNGVKKRIEELKLKKSRIKWID